MVIAILMESDTKLSDDLLVAIIDKVSCIYNVEIYLQWSSLFIGYSLCLQTFADADKDNDGRISKEDWKDFVSRNPSLLKNMTLPYLKYGLLNFFSTFLNSPFSESLFPIS